MMMLAAGALIVTGLESANRSDLWVRSVFGIIGLLLG
jgi:hypothetical protein